MSRTEIERRLRQARWPEPAPDLRAQVLAAVPAPVSRVTWSDRVWFSRAWRLAAVATLVGAVAIEALSYAGESRTELPTAIALAEVRAIDDAGREIGLPPNLVAALGRRALLTDAARTANGRPRRAVEILDVEGDSR